MSGGYIDPQEDGDHQVVMFTIIGQMTEDDKEHWNGVVAGLKQKFPKIASVTLGGKPTPAEHRKKPA